MTVMAPITEGPNTEHSEADYLQQGQKLQDIELEFDETLRQCLVVAVPFTDKVDGAFFFGQIQVPFHDSNLEHLLFLLSKSTVRRSALNGLL